MLINILTLLMGTAMMVFDGPLSRPNVRLQNGSDAPSTESGKYKQAKVAGAIFIAITRVMKGLVINYSNFLSLLPTVMLR